MDGRSTIPSETRQAGIVIRSPQATVSLEDRLTDPEVRMTKYSNITGLGAAISKMVHHSRLSHQSDNDFTRGYMREMIDRDSRVPRGRPGRVLEQYQSRGTLKLETRETVVRQRRDQQWSTGYASRAAREEMRGMWCILLHSHLSSSSDNKISSSTRIGVRGTGVRAKDPVFPVHEQGKREATGRPQKLGPSVEALISRLSSSSPLILCSCGCRCLANNTQMPSLSTSITFAPLSPPSLPFTGSLALTPVPLTPIRGLLLRSLLSLLLDSGRVDGTDHDRAPDPQHTSCIAGAQSFVYLVFIFMR
ncbi:hypothetical protein Sjap_013380 [Stephania japonica]|uniref:Uncharacterized protein n=1 Tax=Stephania japonica TaxID=461633 RepID=A0AAP0IXZ7_9MAGN